MRGIFESKDLKIPFYMNRGAIAPLFDDAEIFKGGVC
jgi:hypothetical protein